MPGQATAGEAALERARSLLEPSHARSAGDARAGYLDLLGSDAPESTGITQDLMLTRWVPAVYERWWRPALGQLAKGLTGPGMTEEIRIARLLLGLSAGDTVLDVACGPGNFSREFSSAVSDQGLVVGVDASATMLARAVADTEAAGIGNVAFARADVMRLPFADDCADAVCCFAALHLFDDPFAALSEMSRVLAPGGRIAIMTSVRRQVTLSLLKPVVERSSGMRLFEAGEIVAALQMRGFADIHQRVSGMVQFVGGRLT